jgi:hypothetical protein
MHWGWYLQPRTDAPSNRKLTERDLEPGRYFPAPGKWDIRPYDGFSKSIDALPQPPLKWPRFGIKSYINLVGPPYSYSKSVTLYVPHVLPLLLCLIIPVKGLFKLTRQRFRSRNRQCSACGYYLGVGSEACPECGELIVMRKALPPA